jgi:hypothetical protein
MVESLRDVAGWTGARFIDDVCALELVCARANALAGRETLRVGPREDGVASTA